MFAQPVRPIAPDLSERVLDRLGFAAAPEPDAEGLRSVYRAYQHRVPFDSLRKRIHAATSPAGPLPGATPDDFFDGFLRYGTGGTCWASATALGGLLAGLGFTVHRGLATMHAAPPPRPPDHGTLVVELEGQRLLLDPSVHTGDPLDLEGKASEGALADAAVRRGDHGETLVFWRPLHKPAGTVFRLEAIGVDAETFQARHEASRAFSIFNHGLHLRTARNGGLAGITLGMRVERKADGSVVARRLDRDARTAALVDDFGIAESVAAAVPDDEPIPPPPGMPAARWAEALAAHAAEAPSPTE